MNKDTASSASQLDFSFTLPESDTGELV